MTIDLFERGADLPSLSPGSAELIETLMRTDLDVAEAVKAVEHFPVIVAKLISIANSAWSNPMSSVANLAAACNRLGLDVTRTVGITRAVGRCFNVTQCPCFDRQRYWVYSIIASNCAAKLAADFNIDPATAKTAGLLHNIGLMLLADRFPVETSAALEAVNSSTMLDDRLRDRCGIGYREAGVELQRAWKLPPILAAGLRCIAKQNTQEQQMNALLQISTRIAGLLTWGIYRPDTGEESEQHADIDADFEGFALDVFHAQHAQLQDTFEIASMLGA